MEYAALLGFVASPDHLPIAVQVLLEDIAIAAVLFRVVAICGVRVAIVLVAALFAAAHIPAILASGGGAGDLQSLVLDTALGVVVLAAVIRARSIWWFFPVHLVLDVSQFFKA